MARWRWGSKAGPPNASKGRSGHAPGLNGVEELKSELESLKAELSSAQAGASERAQAPPQRSRRGMAVAAGVVTVGAGVAAGLIISDQGSKSRFAAPVTAPPAPSLSPASRPAPSPTGPATAPPPAGSTPPPAGSTPPPTGSTPSTTAAPPPTTAAPPPTTAAPPPAASAPATPPNPSGLIVVERGQSFWSLAQAAESRTLGRVPTTAEVTRYWLVLLSANASRLARPGDPDLLYAGQVVLLPPV